MVDVLRYTSNDIPDVLFPSDNHLGIPSLDPTMQAAEVTLPAIAWGSVKRKEFTTRGLIHFYVEDARFTNLFNDCSPVLNIAPPAVVEPNFSLYAQTVLPVAIWYTYQKRWLARFWQSRGIRVLVDLNVNKRYSWLNFLGVPKGWRAYATRGYAERTEDTEREYREACAHAGTEDILFVVVGGSKAVESLACQYRWLHIPDHIRVNGTHNG